MHLGALRSNNTAAACASSDPTPALIPSAIFLKPPPWRPIWIALDREHALPKTIIYNLNPADNYVFATMIGNFQDGTIPGKIQLGSGWWFLDQKEGMEWQMNALSNLGLLSRFVGMVTDSRSFMSYPRHEYFRRVLCNLIGRDIENGDSGRRIPAGTDDSQYLLRQCPPLSGAAGAEENSAANRANEPPAPTANLPSSAHANTVTNLNRCISGVDTAAPLRRCNGCNPCNSCNLCNLCNFFKQ